MPTFDPKPKIWTRDELNGAPPTAIEGDNVFRSGTTELRRLTSYIATS
jgi:hypothetical protein